MSRSTARGAARARRFGRRVSVRAVRWQQVARAMREGK